MSAQTAANVIAPQEKYLPDLNRDLVGRVVTSLK